MPKISVIMPVYIDFPERISWLNEAIRSVIIQSFQDWELIVINDGSPLKFLETKQLYKNENRVRWFDMAHNVGPALVRNTAVGLSESQAILALDSDDMLASETVLEDMYDTWIMDETKIIYGSLRRLRNDNGIWRKDTKPFIFGDYNFATMTDNLNGIMPVTCLHSKECHVACGGWKPIFDVGLEDVEYWLAAGKLGFCGQRINQTTLTYRTQKDSRIYQLQNVSRRFSEMQAKIRDMHSDVCIRGEFPVSCCGGNKSTSVAADAAISSQASFATTGMITKLEGHDEKELVWIEYRGRREAKFTVHKKLPDITYTIFGTGHMFQAHVHHVDSKNPRIHTFKRMGRGQDYLILNHDPTQQREAVIEPEVKEPTVVSFPSPQVAMIERLDKIAAESRGLELEPVAEAVIQPAPVQLPADYFKIRKEEVDLAIEKITSDTSDVTDVSNSGTIAIVAASDIHDLGEVLGGVYNLGDLDLGKFEETLRLEGWTVEMLASSEIGDLTGYPRIGNKRAQEIINKAKELINKT